MTWTALALIPAVFSTATLSGVFGMGGGMILMGVYAALLPIPAAMVLHGATQLASNGSRALLLRRHVHWSILRRYAVGAALALGAFTALRIRAGRGAVYLILGGAPLLIAALPRLRVDIRKRRTAAACGLVVTAAQLTAGASGPVLNAFFLTEALDRREVVATKAVTQSLGHAIKLVYFTALIAADTSAVPLWLYPIVIACALAGARTGKRLLERLSERQFQRWSTRLVLTIAALYAARGALALTGLWS